MHLRSDFSRMQEDTSSRPSVPASPAPSRPVSAHSSPHRQFIPIPRSVNGSPHPGFLSAHASPVRTFMPSPHRLPPASPHMMHNSAGFQMSPQRFLVSAPPGFAPSPLQIPSAQKRVGSPFMPPNHPSLSPYASPQRGLFLAPSSSSKKRARSESSHSSYEYSSDDDSGSESSVHELPHKKARPSPSPFGLSSRAVLTKPPSPPRYYPGGAEEEDIGSSDSDFEENDENASLDDLRDFIDFDPRFNRTNISKQCTFEDEEDPLKVFLFTHQEKPRKWFRAFARNAVGPKLTKPPTGHS